MANITGYYEFHRDCPGGEMLIERVDDAGNLIGSRIDSTSINGVYNAATNAISFNDASEPGDILFVSFYSGYAIPDGNGGVCAMAGTYHEMTFILRPQFRVTTTQGAWYAIYIPQIP